MRSKTLSVELFIDSTVSGAVTFPQANYSNKTVFNLQEQVMDWMRFVATQSESADFSKLTEDIFSTILRGRLEGWITGRFDERELEGEISRLKMELEKTKIEKDACLAKLAELGSNPPVPSDFKAHQ